MVVESDAGPGTPGSPFRPCGPWGPTQQLFLFEQLLLLEQDDCLQDLFFFPEQEQHQNKAPRMIKMMIITRIATAAFICVSFIFIDNKIFCILLHPAKFK